MRLLGQRRIDRLRLRDQFGLLHVAADVDALGPVGPGWDGGNGADDAARDAAWDATYDAAPDAADHSGRDAGERHAAGERIGRPAAEHLYRHVDFSIRNDAEAEVQMLVKLVHNGTQTVH